MRNLLYSITTILLIYSCGSVKKRVKTSEKNIEEVVVIENDSLEYKIIITDAGFNTFLNSIAKPINFYSQQYYENKNIFYVTQWNIKARNRLQYGDFYENIIEYNSRTDYGLDVNYKLFNYFKFIEYKYNIRL